MSDVEEARRSMGRLDMGLVEEARAREEAMPRIVPDPNYVEQVVYTPPTVQYIYKHVVFNHNLISIRKMLAEHASPGWRLFQVVQANMYESVMILQKEEMT